MSKDRQFDRHPLSQAEDSFSTAASYNLTDKYIHFPGNLKGKTVIDIGTGGSSAVWGLRQKDIQAYGVDIRYRNLREVQGSTEKYLINTATGCTPYVTKFKQLPGDLEYIRDQDTGNNTQLPNRFVQWLIDHGGGGYNEESWLAYQRFLKDAKQNPAHYIAARAEQLPIQNSTVDFCYSFECLTVFLIKDRQTFYKAMTEGLRILKPGGEFRVYPFISGNPLVDSRSWKLEHRKTAEMLLRRLEQARVGYNLEPAPDGDSLLKMIKPSKYS